MSHSAILNLAQCDLGVEVILRSATIVSFIVEVAKGDTNSPYYAEFLEIKGYLLAEGVQKLFDKYVKYERVAALKELLLVSPSFDMVSRHSVFSKHSLYDGYESGYSSGCSNETLF